MAHNQSITACAFLYTDEKVFIAKRAESKSFLPGVYELPGGHIEFGENLEIGLQREFQEEFHIDIIVDSPFHAFTYLSDNNMLHNVEVDYFAHMKDPKQEIKLNPEDHSEYKWITREEVDIYFKEDDEVRLAVHKGFELLIL